MGKIADKYYEVDPWSIIENGFDPSHGTISESIFSLGNEYMGVRGYFDEGYSGEQHVGSYFNGFYEETQIKHPARYKGFVDISRDMTNSVDWLYTRIKLDGEQLDLSCSLYEEFTRVLDLKSGILKRSFVWKTSTGKRIKVTFERLLSMKSHYIGCQRVELTPLDFSSEIAILSGLDFTPHAPYFSESNWECIRRENCKPMAAILGKTKISDLHLFSSFRIESSEKLVEALILEDKFIGTSFEIKLEMGKTVSFDKIVVNYAGKKKDAAEAVWLKGKGLDELHKFVTYEQIREENKSYWEEVWKDSDITIEGDPENQQGIRFSIFQLHQTYHGADPSLNIGAKGLSGEAYGGKAFWDTEAYCLQFYLFNNPAAAKNLLSYRYNLLPEAKERAKELDCEGACYPISTIDGIETCGAWQHSSLQIHVSGAIAFGIWHYDKICSDKEFLYSEGIEMLVEISRFYKSRVQQNPLTGEYGYYGVMGVDEFHMMVNNNCLINYLAKKAMAFTVEVIEEMGIHAQSNLALIKNKIGVSLEELGQFKQISDHMNLPQGQNGIYEQHDGYFTLPHIDIHSIPITEFPLYHNWSYDRIYRTDMIKQADVLMMLFLYSGDFSKEIKTVNYDYYEPRCIHESSLSPSVHSILASEIGKSEEAYEFFRFATRLDLDNYNRNSNEGLHITAIAAAWMNIVYGFGGMRSDKDILMFHPTIPKEWESFSFSIVYRQTHLQVKVGKDEVVFVVKGDKTLPLSIYGKMYHVDQEGLRLEIPRA